MYCAKCGKKIDYDAYACNECMQKDKFFEAGQDQALAEPDENVVCIVPEAPRGSRTKGIGGAVVSLVLGYIGLLLGTYGVIFSMYGIIFSASSAMGDEVEMLASGFNVGNLVIVIIGIVLGIIGLVKGIAAIKVFKASRPRPVGTLVLGILGLDSSIASLIFALYNLMMFLLSMIFMMALNAM